MEQFFAKWIVIIVAFTVACLFVKGPKYFIYLFSTDRQHGKKKHKRSSIDPRLKSFKERINLKILQQQCEFHNDEKNMAILIMDFFEPTSDFDISLNNKIGIGRMQIGVCSRCLPNIIRLKNNKIIFRRRKFNDKEGLGAKIKPFIYRDRYAFVRAIITNVNRSYWVQYVDSKFRTIKKEDNLKDIIFSYSNFFKNRKNMCFKEENISNINMQRAFNSFDSFDPNESPLLFVNPQVKSFGKEFILLTDKHIYLKSSEAPHSISLESLLSVDLAISPINDPNNISYEIDEKFLLFNDARHFRIDNFKFIGNEIDYFVNMLKDITKISCNSCLADKMQQTEES